MLGQEKRFIAGQIALHFSVCQATREVLKEEECAIEQRNYRNSSVNISKGDPRLFQGWNGGR